MNETSTGGESRTLNNRGTEASASDILKLESIRGQLPALSQFAYLNTGSVGPLPTVVDLAMRDEAELDLTRGRTGLQAKLQRDALTEATRAAVARCIGADSSEIALTHCTTEGVNIGVWGINWRPGDEVVTTNLEHPAIVLPLARLAERFGVVIRVAEVNGPTETVESIRSLVGSRTRLVALSHVIYSTGNVLPVREIAAVAHDAGALCLVDGAQSVGAIPVDVRELDVDVYALPGQKWLCGPEDTGALYVAKDRMEQVCPSFVGYMSVYGGGELDLHPSACRYEVGSRNASALAGQSASVEWMLDAIGLSWAFARIRHLAGELRARLTKIPELEILTPPDAAGLLSFTVTGIDPKMLVDRLATQNVLIRWIRQPYCARASLGFFNDESDLDRLVDGIRSAQGG